MDEPVWTVDWRDARASAPTEGRSVLRRDRSDLHCERIALTAGLAVCHVQGHCDRPMTFLAPAADEPRAHWQFLAGGAARLAHARGDHDLEPGMPTLVSPPAGGVAWRIPARARVHVISVDVTASALAHWCDSRQAHALLFVRRVPVVLASGAERALYARLRALTTIDADRDAAWRLRFEALVLQALVTGFERLGLAPPRGDVGPGDLARLRRARELLIDLPAPPVTLLALARTVGMPLRRLQRLYARRYGEPLRDAMHRARFEAARRALLDGNASIKQIARDAGFVHATSFTHAFRAYWGHAPSELTSRRAVRSRSARTRITEAE